MPSKTKAATKKFTKGRNNPFNLFVFIFLLLALSMSVIVIRYRQNYQQNAATSTTPQFTHLVGAFSVNEPSSQGPTNIATAVGDGLTLSLGYGTPPATTSAVGQALIANHMQYIDGGVSSLLQYYECHKAVMRGIKYCAKDQYPQFTNDAVVLQAVEDHIMKRLDAPYIMGYWVLDDQPSWETPGYDVSLLNNIHAFIQQVAPQKPTICGFSGSMTPNKGYSWHSWLAKNFTPEGCDMVGWYIYADTGSASSYDWTMHNLLPAMASSLKQQGWDINKEPLIGIPYAFGGNGKVLPSTTDMETQARSFCQFGAADIIWYAWYQTAGFPNDLGNTPSLVSGAKLGDSACKAMWSLSSSPSPSNSPAPSSITPSDTRGPTPSNTPQPINLPAYNNEGTSFDSDQVAGNYDLQYGSTGNSYSLNALQSVGIHGGATATYDGVSFTWPPFGNGIDDNWITNGQIITIPLNGSNGATTLGFLGSATNGPSSGTGTITYTDGTTSPFTVAFSDWTLNRDANPVIPQDATIAQMTYRNTPTGTQTRDVHLFFTSVPLDASKIVRSVTLPATANQGHLHVFAIGIK